MRQKRISIMLVALQLSAIAAHSQETFPFNGVRPKEVTTQAFIHATLWLDANTRIDDAVLVVEKGKIKSAGKGVSVPDNAVVTDLEGKWIYPSFIDLYSNYGMPAMVTPERSSAPRVQMESDRKGAFGWNQAIRTDVRVAQLFEPSGEKAKELRGIGVGVVLTHLMDGIARGTGSIVTTGTNANLSLIRPSGATWFSFNKGSSTQQYPSSLMGSIALLRQTFYDARWYADGGNREERNLSLEALIESKDLPGFFDAGDKWNAIRADRIGDEFGVQYIFRGNGTEYQRIREIQETRGAFILPLDFPSPWNVLDPYAARMVSLAEMKHWELAPHNARMLHEAGVPIALTSFGISEKDQFISALRRLKETGMREQDILTALTLTPAALIRAEAEIGALKPGMWANFFICSGSLFDEDSAIYDHYIQGELHEVNPQPDRQLAGVYAFTMGQESSVLKVEGEPGKYSARLTTLVRKRGEIEPDDQPVPPDTLVRRVIMRQHGAQLTLVVDPDTTRGALTLRLSGLAGPTEWKGRGQNSQGVWFDWQAIRTEESKSTNTKSPFETDQAHAVVNYPFGAFGWTELPQAETVHFIHATVWTNEKEGIIEDGEVLIHNGKIVSVGKGLRATGLKNVRVVDASGKHITAGIIDEHSHIALKSVNEGTQASSAEVQESSVIDPEDIDIYRQLSGGVTASQLLHGSANPIGGQSALVKLRWGAGDQEMLIEGADGFIKFALGENVKQSNWGDMNRVRYPQTRMGVEQVYYDHFIRAKEYGEQWNSWRKSTSPKDKNRVQGIPPRRDLELECLLEILEKKRFVTCHSYQQGEINMLMHVADSMGFRINTFTHILEGYKVADKMRAHGAGGSSFSDWWAYKMEVKDAIPHNGALLWENGITVAFNSDDAEMARRLNQEAAKAVKYGGVPEEEALKFVTLNPARLLHLDHRMGSLKAGKDADLVMWSDHPLSVYAQAEMTFVDGICYFDREKDKQLRESMEKERARLIEKMIGVGKSGGTMREPGMKDKMHFHCDTLGDR